MVNVLTDKTAFVHIILKRFSVKIITFRIFHVDFVDKIENIVPIARTFGRRIKRERLFFHPGVEYRSSINRQLPVTAESIYVSFPTSVRMSLRFAFNREISVPTLTVNQGPAFNNGFRIAKYIVR